MEDEFVQVVLKRSTLTRLESARAVGLTYDEAILLALERVGPEEMERIYATWQEKAVEILATHPSVKRGERPRM